jgi:hypothetical protein
MCARMGEPLDNQQASLAAQIREEGDSGQTAVLRVIEIVGVFILFTHLRMPVFHAQRARIRVVIV